MNHTKQEELAQLQARYPTFSPFVLLKLSMIRYGAVLTPAALEKIQGSIYAFSSDNAFDIRFSGRKACTAVPGPILLRDGTFVYIKYGDPYEDPYQIDWEGGLFLLKEGNTLIDVIDFVPRPEFYGKITSLGTPMAAVADVRAQLLILTAFQRCRFWEGGHQCGFCAFFTGGQSRGEVNCQDVRETIQEALKEPGRFSEISLSGGSDFSGEPPFSCEVDRYIRVLQAIGENFTGRFPCQLMAPAYPKQQLERIWRETGITSYAPNIEVWGKALFQELCPGKEQWVGYEEWIRRTLDAVEVFGRGKVCTQVVAGVELAAKNGFSDVKAALESNFEACEFFASHGVNFLCTIWRPHRATRLDYRPMPPLEYYVRLAEGLHSIRKAHGLYNTNDDYKHCGNHPDSELERGD